MTEPTDLLYDRPILQALHERARRQRRMGKSVFFGAVIALLLILAAVVHTHAPPLQSPSATSWQIPHDLPALDRLIANLQSQKASDQTYAQLAIAYRARYDQSADSRDLQIANEAERRAEAFNKYQQRSVFMQQSSPFFGLAFLLIIIVAIIGWMALLYNGLVNREEAVDERWGQIEAVLQRRLDLIPALVDTVKGAAGHEERVLKEVTEARANAEQALQANRAGGTKDSMQALGNAQERLSTAMLSLKAVAEQYPNLKVNQNFLMLQDQLEGTENRISVERQRYNEAVKELNIALRRFPSNVIASLFGFNPRQYFESQLAASQPVMPKFRE